MKQHTLDERFLCFHLQTQLQRILHGVPHTVQGTRRSGQTQSRPGGGRGRGHSHVGGGLFTLWTLDIFTITIIAAAVVFINVQQVHAGYFLIAFKWTFWGLQLERYRRYKSGKVEFVQQTVFTIFLCYIGNQTLNVDHNKHLM